MRYFPLFYDTQSTHCLVVGGGEVAARKTELLLKTETNITLVAPQACDTIQNLAQQNRINWLQRCYHSNDLNAKEWVFVATNDEKLNQHIAHTATQRKLLVNVVDAPENCAFITPSIIDRNPITIAISSGGVAPVLLRYLRQKLESWIPHNIARLGAFFAKHRDNVKANTQSVEQRRHFWEQVMDGDIAEQVLKGNEDNADQRLLAQLANADLPVPGQVYLVGAGPGDPELLTFKALRLMQKADVVVYDKLVSPAILEYVRRDAEKIYVGKAKSHHTLPQHDINQLLVKLAQAGKRVVRLKGGDPFIFGRGGEEIEQLIEQGVDFQVVPGITAASGAANYAGIPLTHRDHAQSVVFATGHLKDNSVNLNWSALAQANQTLVFYMGVTGLGVIANQLIAHGLAADTPVAIVQSATRDDQRVLVGDLTDINARAAQVNIQPPALIIVGGVVNLYHTLSRAHTRDQWK